MLGQIGDIAPKAVLIGGIAYAAINWAYLGPEFGARTLRADGHIAQCESRHQKELLASAGEQISSIPAPQFDAQREAAANAIRAQLRGPLGQLLQATGQAEALEGALDAYEHQKKIAKATYDKALAAAKAKTTEKLGSSGDYCGCVADTAISDAQNDFAIYSGTLTLFRPAKIRDLDALMLRSQSSPMCAHLKGVS